MGIVLKAESNDDRFPRIKSFTKFNLYNRHQFSISFSPDYFQLCNRLLCINLYTFVSIYRPSPKLVLIILQLCRVALPLMTTDDCNRVELPAWGQEFSFTCSSDQQENKELKISSLLLAKLGDFLVPGEN